MTGDDPRHGTYAGYLAHKRAGQEACWECRNANADKIRRWRDKNPDRAQYFADQNALKQRALHELGRRHPTELREICRALRKGNAA